MCFTPLVIAYFLHVDKYDNSGERQVVLRGGDGNSILDHLCHKCLARAYIVFIRPVSYHILSSFILLEQHCAKFFFAGEMFFHTCLFMMSGVSEVS